MLNLAEIVRLDQFFRYASSRIALGIIWALVYETIYCARGQAENLIKLHKAQLASGRTSCRSPLANQMRLTGLRKKSACGKNGHEIGSKPGIVSR